jgi:2-polyprenyl-6-methoxyphenol hydroxylase-like FAD-dependent oxidoreductase
VRAKKNIGIVGGGIGGIATAVALHQAGIDVVVYEKTPELREVGAGMMLWPNATRVLREMGLLDKVLARSGPNTHFLVRARSGRILMNIALGKFDVPAICMRRSDLLSVLLAALSAKCLQLGSELDDLDQSEGKVRLYFKGGLVKKHDAVIEVVRRFRSDLSRLHGLARFGAIRWRCDSRGLQ